MDKSIHTAQYKVLIDLLRKEREQKKITQEQLAGRLSVQQAVISKIETCERRIDFIEMRQICIALGISPLDFVNKFELILQK